MCSIDDTSNLLPAEDILNSHHCYGNRLEAMVTWGHEGTVSVCYLTEDMQELLIQFPSTKLFDNEQILHQTAISQGLNIKIMIDGEMTHKMDITIAHESINTLHAHELV